MPWYSGIIIALLFLSGCTTQPQIGKKSFENEDNFIMVGMLAEENNITKAENIFNELYKKTNKKVYFKEVIKLSFKSKKYKKTINLVEQFQKKYPKDNSNILKYKIYSLIKLNKLNEALKIAKSSLRNKRNLENYKIVSYIYIQKKDYKNAIKYLKSAYSISHNPDVLVQMGNLFFKYLKKPNEAISYYQTHIRLYGCNEMICNSLANIYRFLYDYDNLIEIYKKLFDSTLNMNYATKIVYLYLELNKYNEAISFINKYKLSQNLLYLVYENRFNKQHTYKDAYKLYKYTKNYKYFFWYSVYKFEKSPKGLYNLKNLVANLEFLIKKSKKPIYLNYLGYILIDYDINPKKGVKLIKEALKENPTAPEFLDSLAWGYYKLKQCKKAYNIISKIDLKDTDIDKHKKIIRRCYDIAKNNKKNRRKSKKRKKHR